MPLVFKSTSQHLKKIILSSYYDKSFYKYLGKNSSHHYQTISQNENERSAQTRFPLATKVVVCGGGLFGTSVAYHLANLGLKDVILVTRDK